MEGLPKDLIYYCLCPYLELVELARCAQVSRKWLEIFRANGAFRHIKDRIDMALPKYFTDNSDDTRLILKYRIYPLCKPDGLFNYGTQNEIIDVLKLNPKLNNLHIMKFIKNSTTLQIEIFVDGNVIFLEHNKLITQSHLPNLYLCSNAMRKSYFCACNFENAVFRLLFPGQQVKFPDPKIIYYGAMQ
jgi:hypothetical protein